MKKISIIFLLLISNLSIISCTEEILTDAVNKPEEHFANDGEEDKPDPEEKPIGG